MSNLSVMSSTINRLTVGKLVMPDIVGHINAAAAEEVEEHSWAMLKTTRVINTVAAKTNGKIALIQGSNLAVGTGTTFAPTDLFGYLVPAGSVYAPLRVIAVNGQTLSLETPFPAPSNPASTYSLIRLLYPIPGAQQILNVTQQVKLT